MLKDAELVKEIECLRGQFNNALDNLLQRFRTEPEAPTSGKGSKRETKKQREERYDSMLNSEKKAGKPSFLKRQ